MSEPFSSGVDAVIDYLQKLKNEGETHVEVSRATLKSLSLAPAAPAPASGTPSALPVDTTRPELKTSITSPSLSKTTAGTAPTPKSPEPAETFGPILPPGEKEIEFEKLKQRVLSCQICPHLARSRKQAVFGTGTIHAALMFVGEAPGADEDEQGEPFVGRAGHLLTKMIQAMGLQRDDIYIGNILKCRPDMPAGSTGNRPPTVDEIANCRPYILSQIDIIRPKALVALGSSAVKGLLGLDTGIGKLRGKWLDFRGIPTMPTYHPSYLLRKAGPSGIAEKRKAWEDLMIVMEKLEMPISEKQKNYFLNAL